LEKRKVTKVEPPQFVVHMTRDELREMMREVFAEGRASASNDGPALLDRSGLARALGCSPSLVDKMRKRGMPTKTLGDRGARFDLATCLEWVDRDSKQSA
jgi:hypothetical protein